MQEELYVLKNRTKNEHTTQNDVPGPKQPGLGLCGGGRMEWISFINTWSPGSYFSPCVTH